MGVMRQTPIKIKRAAGRLNVICIRMELGEADAGGRRRPTPVQGSEFNREFDTLITAIGQAPQMPGDFRVRVGKGSTIQVDPSTLTTNRVGVFAGGDVARGPWILIQAIADGRRGALSIDRYLRGEDLREGREKEGPQQEYIQI
jgi:NADPH-dependent glutamate synthase beta subunit-like oxidoreductase